MKLAFPDIEAVAYEGPKSRNPPAFKHYNPGEIIAGKSIRDDLRFAVVRWHTFRGTGRDPSGAWKNIPVWMVFHLGVPQIKLVKIKEGTA